MIPISPFFIRIEGLNQPILLSAIATYLFTSILFVTISEGEKVEGHAPIWTPDAMADTCMQCEKIRFFSLQRRVNTRAKGLYGMRMHTYINMPTIFKILLHLLPNQHHCRNCGRVICGTCSRHRFHLPKQSDRPLRVCDGCYDK